MQSNLSRVRASDAAHRRGDEPIRWRSVVVQVLAWGVAVVLFALIAVLVIVPRATGSTPYTIQTGSMADIMPPGTIVVVRPEPFEKIGVGQIVTYQLVSGEPEVVTHRVISVDFDKDGVRTLRTKGDENPSADPTPVKKVQVRGVAWYWVPYVGYLGAFGSGQDRQWIAQLIGALLLGYAVFLIISSIVRRRRRARIRAEREAREGPRSGVGYKGDSGVS
jgi:signal peptidase I